MNIGGWLRNLGLERYELLFIENAIDSDVLAELTEGDLEKIGIPLGDRKRLSYSDDARRLSHYVHERSWRECAKRATPRGGCRAPTPHRDDLRSGGLDCSIGAPRSGGHARRDRCLSRRLRPYHANL